MQCKQCNQEFEGRADARYCSPGCRVTANRNKCNSVTDNSVKVVTDNPYPGGPDCGCRHCANVRASGSGHILNHGLHKTTYELSQGELNRVSLPGDIDYEVKGGDSPFPP